jgi:DNA-binding NtrC family response regulator
MRGLIYCAPDSPGSADSGEIANQIVANGWTSWGARDANTVNKLIARHDLRVGLVALPASAKEGLSALNDLFSTTVPIPWVGLAPKGAVVDARMRELIGTWLYDYHTLPADLPRLMATLGHAYGMSEISPKCTPLEIVRLNGEEFIGASAPMRKAFQDIRRIAATDAPVLLAGESGTGKELAALAVHRLSHRGKGPFVAVNCGALPPGLIQSALFGHEKGAFTGAHQRSIGRIETANTGSIFLDEIADLPIDLQVNLLRFLEERTIVRVGGHANVPVDVRVIAATHVDLEQAVSDGRFREDLYYRLNVLNLELPALRQRGGDIEQLAMFFLRRFASESPRPVAGFTQEALCAMNMHDWPGNVRELVNRVRRAAVMCDRRLIAPRDLGLERRSNRQPATLAQARATAEKAAIQNALLRSRQNLSEAARALGISRPSLYRLITRHDLEPVDNSPAG